MSARHSSFFFNLLKAIIAAWSMFWATSCTIVKQYQRDKPFVYKTNINLIGNFSNDEKDDLSTGLKGQLDDSMRVRKLDRLIFSEIRHPPLYDSVNADKSIIFMRALLVSLGYFDDSITYHAKSVIPNNHPHQHRTIVTFDVKPGKLWRLDTVVYNISHPELQKLTDSTVKEAYIKKGDAFAKAPIAIELDRLTELYRNNGYLRFGRDELVGLWDTLDVSLLQPTLDPFEQLEILQRLKERRQQPTVSLEIRLRRLDSARLVKYYNGNITIYPDYTLDTAGLVPKTTIVKGIKVIQYRNTFKPKIFPVNVYLPRDSVYRIRRYIRTINRLNLIGAWRSVNIDQLPRKEQDTVDYVIRLTPSKRYSFSATPEVSLNQSAISGKLFGLGINGLLQNRNKWRAANLANSNIRYGVEFGTAGTSQFIQTKQISAGHSIYFPRPILIEKFIRENRRDNWRTILSANAANTERRLLFNLTSINGSWGYEYQRRRLLLNIKFPNIEYSFLNKRDSLDSLIKINPSLKNIFTDGFVASVIANLTLSGGRDNHLNVFRANFEAASLIPAWIRSDFLDTQVYRFIKIDAEFARLIRYPKSSVALRFFAGVGIADPFNNTLNPSKKSTLP
ncbi:MAG TPA: hypothetical protein VI461_07255, partial [Chitinophagaceae bacterium]|nr:hypothetical protein [Chitinophagaceae bacterium]